MEPKNRYFEVVAKCGHVGRTNCVMIGFAIVAENGKQAAAKAKEQKRVKRDHKNCIQSVKEISFEEFMQIKSRNDADPYLHCKSKWQQNTIENFDERIVADEYNIARRIKKDTKKQSKQFRAKRQRQYEASFERELFIYSQVAMWEMWL